MKGGTDFIYSIYETHAPDAIWAEIDFRSRLQTTAGFSPHSVPFQSYGIQRLTTLQAKGFRSRSATIEGFTPRVALVLDLTVNGNAC